MKGVFMAGPTMEPFCQMYMAVRRSARRWIARGRAGERAGAGVEGLTLVVDDGGEKESEERFPEGDAIEKGGKEAGRVELGDDMRNFGIGRGRHEAGVEGHGAGKRRGALAGRREGRRAQEKAIEAGEQKRTNSRPRECL